jgi:hypothetical protein
MKIYQNLKNFLFLDIETVREYRDYTTFSSVKSTENWKRVAKKHIEDEKLTEAEAYEKKAGLYVEYGKIISVCFGKFDSDSTKKIGVISDTDEEKLLTNVAGYFDKIYEKFPDTVLCGHNIKEFDIPFIVKRMIKFNVKLPVIIKNYLSAKSWDQKATDTLFDWRMSGNRFMSLDSIAEYLGIESSKNGVLNGESVGEYYWNNSINTYDVKIFNINDYCNNDVRVVMDLALRLNNVL